MKFASVFFLILFSPASYADESASFIFHERATLTFETPKGDMTVIAVGSRQVFRDEIEFNRFVGTLVGSGLHNISYDPPMIFELQPGKFVVCASCTAIAMRTFGISDGPDFDAVRYLADAAPRDVARPAHAEYIPTYLIVSAPPSFDLVIYPDRSDLERIFGPGYRIKSYTVEITDAPVTEGEVFEKMPWICDQIAKLQAQRTDENSEGETAVRKALNALEDLANGKCA